MKKLFLLLLIVVFSCQFLFSQNLDSLKNVIQFAEGLERAELLIQLAKLSGRSNSESEQRIAYAEETKSLARELEDSSLVAAAFYQSGEANYYLSRYPEAIQDYRDALNIHLASDDSVNIGGCYNSIGLCFFYSGKQEVAISEFLKALSIYEMLELKEEMAGVYSNIGMVYQGIDDHKLAIENYERAVSLNKSIHDTLSIAINYNGLATSYFFLEKYDLSKEYYQLAYKMFDELNQRTNVAITLNNIANIYVNQKDSLEFALEYYNEAIKVFREINDVRNEAYVMEGLGGVYREMGQYEKSVKAFRDCIEFAKKHKAGFELLKLAYDDLAYTYEEAGDFEEAYKASKFYSYYSDSLLNETRLSQIAEQREKFETEKKEAEIERLNAVEQVHLLKIERDKQIRLLGAILILLLVVITLFISIGYLNKKKTNQLLSRKNIQIDLQKKELEKLNASKNKFFSILAHDLKNPFHTVMGYSYLMHKNYHQFKDEERKKYSADIYKSTNSIFRLLQNLLDWSRSQTGRIVYNPQAIDFKDVYENIIGLLAPVAEAKKIKVEHFVEEESIVLADPMMVETIIRNLLSNAIKFSHENSVVKLSAARKNDKLLICIEDGGVGINNDDLDNLFKIDSKVKHKGTNNEDGSGLGLILCKEFVEKNGGTITAKSEPGEGSTFCVTLPLYVEAVTQQA